jgi:hypothetical protein
MDDPRTIAAKLTAQFHAAFGSELRCVVVFGSFVRGESVPGVSDLNLLVLLESMTVPTLHRAAPLLREWVRQGNTPPHMYSWDEWQGMRDTFALEIADMSDAREVLWGEDPIGNDPVSYANSRNQTEREIRDTMLQLRLRLMLNSNSAHEIGALLLSGIPSFATYMRALLRLHGEAPGLATRPVIERAAKLAGADPAPMLRCWDSRRARQPLSVPLPDPLVEAYFAFAQALLDHVDGLPTSAPATASAPRGGAA